MQKEAPDLWDWRAASFDFTGDQAPRVELLRELITRQPGDDLGLSGQQRQARAQMLDELLAELEREGPPKSKRQAVERANLVLALGVETWRLGGAAEALRHFERALDLYRETGDRRGEGYALDSLGDAWIDLGEPRRAIELYEQALTITRDIGDRRGEGSTLGNLGIAWRGLGAVAGDRVLRAAPRDRARHRRRARRGERPVQLGPGARCSWRAGGRGAAGARGARHLRGDRGQASGREGARAAGRVGRGGRERLRREPET